MDDVRVTRLVSIGRTSVAASLLSLCEETLSLVYDHQEILLQVAAKELL
jgi:hypothetical protein